MKILSIAAAVLLATSAFAGGITVRKAQGDVSVRHGVTEVWTHVAAGDVLRPDDSMKTGTKSSALLVVREETGSSRTLTLPPEVIVDMSDIRQLSQEELMLKLTMEKVRASSSQWKNEELKMPEAAVVHGQERSHQGSVQENDAPTGWLQFNGTRVLFENGYYSTCVLKAMEVFRLYPALAGVFENRLLLADALGRAELRGEALAEYGAITTMVGLTAEQAVVVKGRMEELRQQ